MNFNKMEDVTINVKIKLAALWTSVMFLCLTESIKTGGLHRKGSSGVNHRLAKKEEDVLIKDFS